MSRPDNFREHWRRDSPQFLLGDDTEGTTRKPPPPSKGAPSTPAPSWWSKYGGTLAKGVGDVAAPWIQKGLNDSGFTSPTTPTAPLPPEPKKTSPWVYAGVGVGALGVVALLAHMLGGGKRKR